MGKEITIIDGRRLAPTSLDGKLAPAIIDDAGAGHAYLEFFLAKFPNPNTRRAYRRIVDRFLSWSAEQGAELGQITPAMCGEYRDMHADWSIATKKQMVSALRGFFDSMVERHFCIINPAASTAPPRQTVAEGKTPEIRPKDAERLIASVDATHVVGIRDRAILAVMMGTGCRRNAVAQLKKKDLFYADSQWNLFFHEKNGSERTIPVRHDLEGIILDYLNAAGLRDAPGDTPLFRPAIGRTKKLADKPMHADAIGKMLKRRLKDAGLPSHYSPHSFRVMVLTDLCGQGEDIHDVAYLAGHRSTRTTQLYDRSKKEVTRNLVERIRVNILNNG